MGSLALLLTLLQGLSIRDLTQENILKNFFSWLFLVLFLKGWFKKAENSPHNVNNDQHKNTLPTALQEKRTHFFTLLKVMEQKKMKPLKREKKTRGFNKH